MIEIIMMIAFILALLLSFWKLYMFMPNKVLDDDDQNEASVQELQEIMHKHILSIEEEQLNEKSLYSAIISDEHFDQKHFWRFNENRLRQLLVLDYLKYQITDTSDAPSTLHSRIHQLKSLLLHHQK